jgi:putative FmdB family regulatory protein
MPTYEYKCGNCGHVFEKFQNINSKPLQTCPICKKEKLIRLIGSGGGIIFKGWFPGEVIRKKGQT